MTRRDAMTACRCTWTAGDSPTGRVLDEPVCGAPRLPGHAYCAEHEPRQWLAGSGVHYTRIADSCRFAWTRDLVERRHVTNERMSRGRAMTLVGSLNRGVTGQE